jgi:hypothetical protein
MSCLAPSEFWHGTQSAPYGIGSRVVSEGQTVVLLMLEDANVGGWQGGREGGQCKTSEGKAAGRRVVAHMRDAMSQMRERGWWGGREWEKVKGVKSWRQRTALERVCPFRRDGCYAMPPGGHLGVQRGELDRRAGPPSVCLNTCRGDSACPSDMRIRQTIQTTRH